MTSTREHHGLALVHSKTEAAAPGDLIPYRAYTRALLRRYFRMSINLGRLPSALGGMAFRARVSSYPLRTFEDAVIFVHDIDRSLEKLEPRKLEMLAGVVLLEFTIREAARRLNISVQAAERRYYGALDDLSRILLDVGLLRSVFSYEDSGDVEPAAPATSNRTNLPPKKGPVSERLGPAAQRWDGAAK